MTVESTSIASTATVLARSARARLHCPTARRLRVLPRPHSRSQHAPHHLLSIMSDSDDAEFMLAVATAFSNDDDNDIAAALLAVEHHYC